MMTDIDIFSSDNYARRFASRGARDQDANISDYFVFGANHASLLRNPPFRICGRFIGNVGSSEQPMPFKLNRYEFALLIEKAVELGWKLNVVSICESASSQVYDRARWQEMKQSYEDYLRQTIEAQTNQFREQRYNQLLAMKDKILRGKSAKLNEKLKKLDSDIGRSSDPADVQKFTEARSGILADLANLENDFERELERFKTNPSSKDEDELAKKLKENRLVEIFIETPAFYTASNPAPKVDPLPISDSVSETCKYKAFRYFWSNGYCLSSGTKFGGDFLVYPGDPSQYHSKFILVCFDSLDEYRSVHVKELVAYARMATSVKKTFLFAVPIRTLDDSTDCRLVAKLNRNEEIHFISVNWSHL